MPSFTVLRTGGLAAAAIILATNVPAGAAGPITVTLNGSPLNLSPAPTERAGRVFVPLRGVFENMGATVVYDSGTINATRGRHTVSLRIGSPQATVDGQPQTVDVAPFIVGASTYVPLRFISQALGAAVNYDGTNDVVAITMRAAENIPAPPPNQIITPIPARPRVSTLTLADALPVPGASVMAPMPTIEARFAGGYADPNSVRVALDGADVTADATRSPRGFTYAPRSPLQPGSHMVRVAGIDASGARFVREWSFDTSGSAAVTVPLGDVRPRADEPVGNPFIVSGRTVPGARVSVHAGVSSIHAVGGVIGAILGSSQGDSVAFTVRADESGRFASEVSIGAPPGSRIVLVLTATDPRTGAASAPVREAVRVQ